jgi:hypothetical protein
MKDKPYLSPRPIETTVSGAIVAAVFLFVLPHMPNFQFPNMLRSLLPSKNVLAFAGVSLLLGTAYGILLGCSHWLALRLTPIVTFRLVGKTVFVVAAVGGFVIPFILLLKR